jgi:hypothetical protein
VKLSDVERKPPDILSDLSETEVYCLSDPSVLVSDRTVALSDVNKNVAAVASEMVKWKMNLKSSDILSDDPVKVLLRPEFDLCKSNPY